MSDPAPLAAARVSALIADWIAIMFGRHDRLPLTARAHSAIAVSGAWTLDASTLWVTANGAGATLVVPFESTESQRVVGHGALVWAASTASLSQPAAEVVVTDTAGTAVAAGSTVTADPVIGWHLLEWSGAAALTADGIGLLRIVAGAAGDRFAAGMVALDNP